MKKKSGEKMHPRNFSKSLGVLLFGLFIVSAVAKKKGEETREVYSFDIRIGLPSELQFFFAISSRLK